MVPKNRASQPTPRLPKQRMTQQCCRGMHRSIGGTDGGSRPRSVRRRGACTMQHSGFSPLWFSARSGWPRADDKVIRVHIQRARGTGTVHFGFSVYREHCFPWQGRMAVVALGTSAEPRSSSLRNCQVFCLCHLLIQYL